MLPLLPQGIDHDDSAVAGGVKGLVDFVAQYVAGLFKADGGVVGASGRTGSQFAAALRRASDVSVLHKCQHAVSTGHRDLSTALDVLNVSGISIMALHLSSLSSCEVYHSHT